MEYKYKLLFKGKLLITGDAFNSCAALAGGMDELIKEFDNLLGLVTSASPRTCRRWAVLRKSVSCSCPIFTSPLYMNLKKPFSEGHTIHGHGG
jgi:hypothetical protein